MTSTSLLMFSPELSLYRELCNTSILASHTRINSLTPVSDQDRISPN